MGGKNNNLLGVIGEDGQLYVFTEKNGNITSEKLIKSEEDLP